MIMILFAFGCNQASNEAHTEMAEASDMTFATSQDKLYKSDNSNGSGVENQEPAITKNLKLIKRGSIAYETIDLAKTSTQINAAIVKYGGYSSSEHERNSSSRITRDISIRVPSQHFDKLLEEISVGVSRFDRKEINVDDVTEEFFDLSARLKSKKAIESRLIQLLAKANKIPEILEVEREIGQVRMDIERMEGRMNYLKNQVSLSTLDISYYKVLEATSVNNNGFWSKIRRAIVNGWDALLTILVGLVTIWPIFLILGGGFFILRRYRKRMKKS